MNKRYQLRCQVVFIFFCLHLTLLFLATYTAYKLCDIVLFMQLGEKQYSVTLTTNPPRGIIYDRSGKNPLAINKDSLAAFILPKKLTSPQTLKPFLKKHFPQAYERLKAAGSHHFMYVARRLTDEQLELITRSAITDIQLLNEPHRFYPIPSAGHIIGITDIDNKGILGLELEFNKRLAGSATTYCLERDARLVIFILKNEQPKRAKMVNQ